MIPTKFIQAGEIEFSTVAAEFKSVVTFGMVLSVFDVEKKMGAICHFLYPVRKSEKDNNSLFAAPCIIRMLSEFEIRKSNFENLEVQAVGGAHLPGSPLYDLSMENQEKTQQILAKKGLKANVTDWGGHRGRRIVFNPTTGEMLVAKVNKVRKEDWVFTGGLPLKRS